VEGALGKHGSYEAEAKAESKKKFDEASMGLFHGSSPFDTRVACGFLLNRL
jgi:hypothetical protein